VDTDTSILVVDDEPDIADLFRQQFRRDVRAGQLHHGIRLVRARCSRACEDDARSVVDPDPDINMSGVSGLEICRKSAASAQASR
jgi:CheY-like chemotaxis protein